MKKDSEKEKQERKKKLAKRIKNAGVNIDKAEYQEIVLSNSANPNKSFYSNNYYD